MTRVVHCKKEQFDVYIGRPSIYGNPFVVGRDGKQGECVEKYREYFLERTKNDTKFLSDVRKLKGMTIACWCKPKACHGDVIAEFLDG